MASGIGGPTVILLAAGSSARLGNGKDKLLVDLGGMPMLQRTLECYTKSTRVGDVLVVLRPGQKEPWSWLASLTVHLLENPDPSRGMISSVRTALESAWAKGKDFLLAPADVPFVKPEMIDRIVLAFRSRKCEVLIPVYRGLGGHPGMYAASTQRDFFMHGDRQGAKEVLLRHRDATVRLAVPEPDVCFDVDTESDARIAMDPSARWARVDEDADAKTAERR